MKTGSIAIHGHGSTAFALLRDTFERNFAEDRESAARIALIVGGEKAIDLWARSLWNGRGIDANAIASGAFYLEMMDAMIECTGEFAERFPRKPMGRTLQLAGPISIWHPHQVTS